MKLRFAERTHTYIFCKKTIFQKRRFFNIVIYCVCDVIVEVDSILEQKS